MPRNSGKMNQSKICGLLGLCKKSGNAILGTEMTVDAVRSNRNRVRYVLVANDASDNTKKRVTDVCNYRKIAFAELPLSTEELGHLMGKKAALATVGVASDGFAKAIGRILAQENDYEEQREE